MRVIPVHRASETAKKVQAGLLDIIIF